MSKILRKWLADEWKANNHHKYHKYFEEWIINLTTSQIAGFNKMRTSNFIPKIRN